MDDEGVVSKLDYESEEEVEEDEYNEICARNNYYEDLILKNDPPIGLNSCSLQSIANKSVLENQILKNTNHKSTLIPEFKINREFILEFLKNYSLVGMNKEDADFLLKKYFNEEILESNELSDDEEERIEYVTSEKNSEVDDFEEMLESKINSSSVSENIKSEISQTEIQKQVEDKELKKKIEIPQTEITKQVNEKKEKEINKKIVFSSLATDIFDKDKTDMLKKNNISHDKIKEVVEVKKYFNSFFKGELQKKNGIDKKVIIVQYIKTHSQETFDTSFFDYKDSNGEFIFDEETVDEWYSTIIEIEKKFETACEFSYFIIISSLYGIEWIANWLNISQFKNITSEMSDLSNLPKHLANTNKSLAGLINNYVPNNIFMDMSLFLGNVYMKNTARNRFG